MVNEQAEKTEGSAYITSTFPDAELLRHKLTEAGIYGKETRPDQFYSVFVNSISGKNLNPIGLNMAWEMSAYSFVSSVPEYLQQMQQIMSAIGLSYNNVVDAITEDAEFAQQAKELRERFLEAELTTRFPGYGE